MSNARFSILQARAISDARISDAQFRTLAALGMYADKNGWCFPSLKTLGKDLNKSAQAVGRDTIALRKIGYLEVKNRYDAKTHSRHSNLYRLVFDFNVDDSTLSTSDVDSLSTPDVEVNVPINDPVNFNNNERVALLATLYQNNITMLNDMSRSMIVDAANEYTDPTWYTDAFKIAVENNIRKWNYIETILRNWKEKGRDWKPAKPNSKRQQRTKQTPVLQFDEQGNVLG